MCDGANPHATHCSRKILKNNTSICTYRNLCIRFLFRVHSLVRTYLLVAASILMSIEYGIVFNRFDR